MKYSVEHIDEHFIRFIFSFPADEYHKAIEEYVEAHKKEYLKQVANQNKAKAVGFFRPIINDLVTKAYTKAANEYPEEIYYTPEISILQDDAKRGLICAAKVQVSPIFKLGDYKAMRLTEEELKEVEKEAAGVPEPNRADTRRYMIQTILVGRLAAEAEGEVPDTMAGERASEMVAAFEQHLGNNGKKIEDYYKECQTNEQELYTDFAREAVKQLQARLALLELAKAEGITATDEEYEKELKRLSEMYMMPMKRMREIFAKREGSNVRRDISISKAADYLAKMADELYPMK